MPDHDLYLGIDLGTSGVRALVIDAEGTVRARASRPMPPPDKQGGAIRQEAAVWWAAVQGSLSALSAEIALAQVAALAVDGTSGTLLLTDAAGRPLEAASMYNDASAAEVAERIKAAASPESGAHGATSPLARLLVAQDRHQRVRHALHQADWIAARLTGDYGRSDANNALKLGYDPVAGRWPDWLEGLGVRRDLLPAVQAPGTVLGPVADSAATALGLSPSCRVVAGTTDGCASFLATGAEGVGDAVTALGSTMTLKLLADRPVFAPAQGVYSHKLGECWLVGGASNSGGAALLRFFTPERLAELTPNLRPEAPLDPGWHPLPGVGERFPIADPDLAFEPGDRPDDEAVFLQALMEGVAGVERRGYDLLRDLGCPDLRAVRTVGGGAANPAWGAIRARHLGVPMLEPVDVEAAYGSALLAMRGVTA